MAAIIRGTAFNEDITVVAKHFCKLLAKSQNTHNEGIPLFALVVRSIELRTTFSYKRIFKSHVITDGYTQKITHFPKSIMKLRIIIANTYLLRSLILNFVGTHFSYYFHM